MKQNDEYLGDFFSHRKTLWTTSNQLFPANFPCLITPKQCAYVYMDKKFFGPICVRYGPKIWRIFIAILFMIVSNRSKSQAKEFKSCIKNMSKALSYKNNFMSNLWFETYHLTGRFIRDQLQPVSFIFDRLQILVRIMSYVFYQIPISRGVQNIFPQHL